MKVAANKAAEVIIEELTVNHNVIARLIIICVKETCASVYMCG